MKNLKGKIFALVSIFALMIADLNPFTVNAGRENLTYVHKVHAGVIFDNSHNNYHGFSITTVGGNQAYCLDYGYDAPENTASLTYIKTVRSNKLVSVISNGYPNKTVAQLGAKNVEEAYLGTQMAVWQVVNGTSYTKGQSFNMNNVQATPNNTELVADAKKIAANILSKNTYNPSITVTGGDNVDYKSYVEMNKIGPFKVNVTDYNYTTFKATVENAPKGTLVVDKDNHIRSEYNKGEEVYVLVDKKVNPTQVKLNVSVTANEKIGAVYGLSGNRAQNFVFLDFEQKEIKANKTFTWEKREGKIEIVKIDQDGNPVKGAEFKIVDESGKQITAGTTDIKGKILTSNLPIGTYKVTETKAPSGYIMDTKTYTVKVVSSKTTSQQVVNQKIIGGLEIFKIDEDTEAPIEGVKFEVYDSNKKVISTITTGKDGKAVLKMNNVVNGTYYYKEISAPDSYVVDNTMKEFKITSENKVAKVTVTNKQITGKLEITKLDDSRVSIEGVKFNILASDKKTIIETL